MAVEILVSEGAVLTVWGKPHKNDMTRILAEVTQAAQRYGKPIVYVTRVPLNAPTPDAGARRDLDALLPSMMRSCSSYHVILDGSGFLAALKRGVLTGLLQPIWQARVFFVHASALDVLNRIDTVDRANVTRLLKLAGRRGLLQCPSPVTLPPGPNNAFA